MELTFDKFIIRQISAKDAEDYFSFVNNNRDRIATYFPKSANTITDIQSTINYIAERIDLAKKKEFFTFIIFNNATNKIVGVIFLKNIDWNIPKAELGFFVDKNYEGQGITTKGISLVIEYCFQTMKLNKIFMRIAEDNLSSRRIAKNNGFTVEGILRSDFKTFQGKLIDVMYYGLLMKS